MRRVILGTDWWTDCDDAVAMRLICRAVKQKEIDLLGIGINACMPYSVASLRGFLTAEGVGDIPLGLDTAATDFGGQPPYQRRLAEDFCPCGSNADAEDALHLYRRLLATAEEPVEIIEIGYPQVLAALLQSEGDELSPLSGRELLQSKVSRLWVMAGKWDADGEKENNFCRNARSRRAAATLCDACPVPITFLGWEVGFGVLSGGRLSREDHLYRVLADHGSAGGRHSWDPMLTLLALIGDEAAAGYDTVTGKARVDAESGANYFCKDPNGSHRYVIPNRDKEYYRAAIDARL